MHQKSVLHKTKYTAPLIGTLFLSQILEDPTLVDISDTLITKVRISQHKDGRKYHLSRDLLPQQFGIGMHKEFRGKKAITNV